MFLARFLHEEPVPAPLSKRGAGFHSKKLWPWSCEAPLASIAGLWALGGLRLHRHGEPAEADAGADGWHVMHDCLCDRLSRTVPKDESRDA